MDAATRKLVCDRAADRCEYCLLPQSALPIARFHLEHIIARQHGGSDAPENLALACHHCNLHKGPNLAGVDPQTGTVERLFDPRQNSWETHFERRGVLILGLTPSGRATVAVLDMNSEPQLDLRRACESHKT
jgi:hypothetical protein